MTDAARPTTAWIWGGELLLGSAVLPLILGSPGLMAATALSTVFAWVGMLAFSASMIVFALGIRGHGSVVARRTPGVVALLVLAAVTPAVWVATALMPYSTDDPGAYLAWGYIDVALRFAAALAAVVAIGRARAVPPPWQWAPAWGLAVVVAAGVLTQVVAVSVLGTTADQEQWQALNALSVLVSVAVPSLLGILAIVLGSRAEPRGTVPVFPSAAPPAA